MAATATKKNNQNNGEIDIKDDFVEYVEKYAREKPGIVALWCFGLGFIVGWKLKPW